MRSTFTRMADITFYHLTSTSLDYALPKLLEKALGGRFRVNVRVANELEAERLGAWLWSYDPDSFLPHGTAKDGHAEQQSIYITAGEENPADAKLLIVTQGQQLESTAAFERVLDVFNGADEQQVASARARWQHYSAGGHTLSYIRQTETGGWEKQSA